jgi:uncharacterized protein (DUF433 family)/DNA-binding transcriptional MerR regulator
MATSTRELRFERRLYTVPQAARLVGMSASTLDTWARGYTRRPKDRSEVRQGPVITALPTLLDDPRAVPFIGLVEATVVQAFRQTGLPMQRIRKALSILASEGELDHPLASRKLYTDGATVLYDYARSEDDKQLALLTVVHTRQRVFHDVIRNYLARITFDDRWATELILPVTERSVLRVVPNVSSGEPLFIRGGAPLSAVRSRALAGEPIASLAADYDVPVEDIEDALHAVWPQTHAA